jgi:hypothetical protein
MRHNEKPILEKEKEAMKMVGKSKIAAFAFSMLFATTIAAGTAHAACNPSAIQGNWWLHGMSHDKAVGSTVQCLIKVKTDGTGGVKAGSKCKEKLVNDNFDFESGPGTTGGGKSLKVASNCKVTGGIKVKIDNTVNNTEIKGTNIITIESAQMSKNGNIITGVGRSVFKGTVMTLPPLPPFSDDVMNNSVFYFTMNKR